jgi:DNA transformation protein
MPRRSEFVDYLLEQLAPLGDVTARGMFGGWGIFHEGRMFALVADDTFYFKVDDVNRSEFEREGLQPFRYGRADKEVAVMSYYQPPTSAIDDRDLLCAWARKGVEAAARAATKKKPKKKRP